MKTVRAAVCGGFLLFFVSLTLFPQENGAADAERRPLIPSDGLVFGQKEALDFTAGGEAGYDDGIFGGLDFRLDYTGGPFGLVADFGVKNDQKYAPTRVMIPEGNIGGFYLFLREGGLTFTREPLSLRAGRFAVYDEVDSPYSLFINSLGHEALTMNMRLESEHWIYQSQWIELSSRNSVSSPAWNEYFRRKDAGNWTVESGVDPRDTSGLSGWGFPDRGINYKVYALKMNGWRLGLLDAVVYTERSFDAEYFLNPVPQVLVSYAKDIPGRPWATDTNENALVGLFFDIDRKDAWSAYAQLLVDDISFGWARFLYNGFPDNPWKAAWALGGRLHTRFGRFGFHHGGALKFTFEPVGVDGSGRYAEDAAATAYGYTRYPETRYFDSENGGDAVEIFIEDNMAGYKYGENNLAFQVDYQTLFQRFLVTAELELVIAGANSPANPWQDYGSRSDFYDSGKSGSQLLDGRTEKRVELRLNVSRKIGNFAFWTGLAVGGRFNKLELERSGAVSAGDNTVDNSVWIWKPSRRTETIFRFSVGFKYTLNIL